MKLRQLYASDITTHLIYARLAEIIRLTPVFITPLKNQQAEIKRLKELDGDELKAAVNALSIDEMTPTHNTLLSCSKAFHMLSKESKKLVLFEALTMLKITKEELFELLGLFEDEDGKPMPRAEMRGLKFERAYDMALDALVLLSETQIDLKLLEQGEKEILKSGRISITEDMAEIAANNPDIPLNKAMSLSVKRVLSKWHKLKL